jgi:nicotinamidase-related amidase
VSRVARVQDGYISSLIRARSRARHHDDAGGPAMASQTTDRPTAALLVMDVQKAIVERFGDSVLEPIERAIAAARGAGVRVIYVRVALRPGAPEVSPRNRTFRALRDPGGTLTDDDATAIHPAVAPQPGDVVVVKRRVSAFAGSDLDVVLRAGGIEELVLCGIATSGVVLSTLRLAADLDYGLTVLRDACADADDEVHRVLLDKVFPRQADVVDVAAWAASLEAAARVAAR